MNNSEENNPDAQKSDDPKIIVDSDWKEQVAKEREAIDVTSEAPASESSQPESSQPESSQPESSQVSRSDPPSEASTTDPGEMPPIPPATLEVLITMLFTQAMTMLGQMPDPSSDGEVKVNKPFAKHYIDTLEMLGEKTKGNLSDEESTMLAEALHALRMMYVNTKN